MQHARELRPVENDYGSSFSFDEPAPPSPSKQLSHILREGPEVGVHTLIWCDTHANLNRVFRDRQIDEFSLRLLFQMSGDDSRALCDSEAASRLGAHRTLFYNDERGGRLEKLRPYRLPELAWWQAQAKGMGGRRDG